MPRSQVEYCTDLFAEPASGIAAPRSLGPCAALLPGFCLRYAQALRDGIESILARAPLRRMTTPGGHVMSVEMTNCGALGWVSDRRGYRYAPHDPTSGREWPAMPDAFAELAARAAARVGFDGFAPDACLINRYAPGARMSLHQDRNERDLGQPIVSISLGLAAIFLWGGAARGGSPRRIPLHHGDVLVWGGADRLRYHGIQTLAPGRHPQFGAYRFNLTFRKAG